jgi:uncharacterized membrane protein
MRALDGGDLGANGPPRMHAAAPKGATMTHPDMTRPEMKPFPLSAGIFLGMGLGGFFDGIVLHQVLQWHHMATSAGYPADSVENLRLNTLLDGLFHAATYALVAIGIAILWRTGRRGTSQWRTGRLVGSLLVGFGSFNLVEGLVNHQLLGIHHVNETAPRDAWLYWDLGFLIWGAMMLLAGWRLIKFADRPVQPLLSG